MATKKHVLKNMSGNEAKEILQRLLGDLNGIEESDLTTFELSVIRHCSTTSPSNRRGVENILVKNE
jgi:hypothetical protein